MAMVGQLVGGLPPEDRHKLDSVVAARPTDRREA